MSLLKNVSFSYVAMTSTGAQGTTAIQAAKVLDMSGYDGVVWVAKFAANANSTGGESSLYHMHSDSTSTTDMVSVTGTADIATQSGVINQSLLVLDVYKPLKRYVSAYVTKDGANAVGVDILGIQYKTRGGPVTQPTSSYGVGDSELTVSPTT